MKKRQLGISIILLASVALVLTVTILGREASTTEMYHFTTRWFFHAPIERVWENVVATDEWKQAAARENGVVGVGTVIENEVKGDLPYTLHFTTEVTRYEPPFVAEATSSGDLVGTGKWILESRDGGTAVTFYWDVGMSNPFFNLISKIPAVKDAMVENHDGVMEEDYRQLVAKLESAP